ncbi:glycoside hydrolase family 20 protein [Annulohypoxylon maeteangense]|uniref:glycoside hydrolase family 20 protein n=1 Tax=Annulohypoxylon maeteangense TaxID=1927788 RepID=UPI002008BBA2|nr:glycoside hydrolase family 20 protein [Annulohypoxylon maeteangense]KAI0887105.1 glycoside hydrolase family 20 protein [Annulohypoxylon maeteangense]
MIGPYFAYLAIQLNAVLVASRIVGIPAVPFTTSESSTYSISSLKSLVVDSKYAESRDETGETLIPPSLQEFANTFVDDLHSTLDLNIDISVADQPTEDAIFLTLGDPNKYKGVSGAQTSEGYSLSVNASGIVISGASPLGVWWGTRTVLQQAILSNGSLGYGDADDSPGWGIRGMMLDAARHYYPPEFIVELCSYMSFFKQNTFHIHLSDNLYNNVAMYSREQSLELYARFRLWSDSDDLAGLSKYKNESYTREQFEEIQLACVSRGVTVIPEIEAPGHSLVIVQWKPELALSSDLSQLNISHPETIPTMKTIWSTFLDWFHSKTVHIGADEYKGDPNEYNRFVNEMASYIYEESGKSIRIWGTFPPKPEYTNVYTNVSIQHWEFFEDNPYHDYILNNYSVLNSDDTFYVVNKWSGSYPPVINYAKTFNGNPATGGIWQPYIFDANVAANNPEKTNPFVLGEVAALWNDYGANATVYSEAYYAWKDGIPALADKQWGGDLSEPEFTSAFSTLFPFIPGQNLDRAIPSTTSTIFHYNSSARLDRQSFTAVGPWRDTALVDQSGNGYDASTTCTITSESTLNINSSCSLKTPLLSKGRGYTLSLRLLISSLDADTDATLVTGTDSALMLTPNLTLFASGNYYRLNTTLPVGTWVDLSIIGRGNRTFASVQEATGLGEPLPEVGSTSATEEEFLAVLGVNGVSLVWAPIAVEAPIAQVGGEGSGWTGELAAMRLSSET